LRNELRRITSSISVGYKCNGIDALNDEMVYASSTDLALQGKTNIIIKLPTRIVNKYQLYQRGTYRYVAVIVDSDDRQLCMRLFDFKNSKLSCSYGANTATNSPTEIAGLPNITASASDVYSIIHPNVSTRVSGHPVLICSHSQYESSSTLSMYALAVLYDPSINRAHLVK
jgi:hypothetical protein